MVDGENNVPVLAPRARAGVLLYLVSEAAGGGGKGGAGEMVEAKGGSS